MGAILTGTLIFFLVGIILAILLGIYLSYISKDKEERTDNLRYYFYPNLKHNNISYLFIIFLY